MLYNLHDTATNTTRKALRATSPTTESIQHPPPITTGSAEKFPGKHLTNQDLESRCTLTDFCQLLQISRGAHSAGREQRLIKTKKQTNNHTHPSGANWNLYSAPENTWVALQTRGYPPRALSFPFFLAARGSRSPPISARRRRRGPETHLRPVRWRYKPPSAQVTNIQTSSNYRGLAGALRMLRPQGFPTATLRKIKGKIY